MGILVGTEKINSYTKKQESYILQGNGEHSAGRAGDSITAGSEDPGGLGAGPWL